MADVFSGTPESGYCAGDTGVCLVFYLICDGQPWPLPYSVDATPEPGHLVNPAPRLAFLSQSDGPLVPQPLVEAALQSIWASAAGVRSVAAVATARTMASPFVFMYILLVTSD